MALNNHCATALGPRLGLGLRLDFGSQVWFVQYLCENLVVVLYAWPDGRKVSKLLGKARNNFECESEELRCKMDLDGWTKCSVTGGKRVQNG